MRQLQPSACYDPSGDLSDNEAEQKKTTSEGVTPESNTAAALRNKTTLKVIGLASNET